MNDYYEVRVDLEPCCEDATDLLAALLGDCGYETFVPDSTGLTAYVKAEYFSLQALDDTIAQFPMACKATASHKLVPGQDWNEEWEKHYFKPIIIEPDGTGQGQSVVVHSSFHTDVPKADFDIVIDPKMAFGTGHHSTTSLVIGYLLDLPLQGKRLIDMGTGTGILAILAAMRGATDVVGIEIDSFAYENALDNVKLNHHPEIRLINSDASALAALEPADVLVANINRNIITADIDRYTAALKQGGTMILSGFYHCDIPVIEEAAAKQGLSIVSHRRRPDDWVAVQLVKR